MLEAGNFEIMNLDCVVVTEAPKIAPFKSKIAENIAAILGIPRNDVNLKGKSKEKLDAVGRGEAIECFSIAMIRFKNQSVSASDSDSKT
jgi:2-C-methyl-D-erythritol 2,4-cyclodiphosphate synthase